jgi:hypothetical protein
MLDSLRTSKRSELKDAFERNRIVQLRADLEDLESVFPEHSTYAVSRSLARWQRWAVQQPEVGDGVVSELVREGPSGGHCYPARSAPKTCRSRRLHRSRSAASGQGPDDGYGGDMGGTGLEPVTPSLSSWCSPN